MKPRSGCFAERLDGSGQIGDDFTNGNQPVSFTHHSFILPCASDKDRGTTSKQTLSSFYLTLISNGMPATVGAVPVWINA